MSWLFPDSLQRDVVEGKWADAVGGSAGTWRAVAVTPTPTCCASHPLLIPSSHPCLSTKFPFFFSSNCQPNVAIRAQTSRTPEQTKPVRTTAAGRQSPPPNSGCTQASCQRKRCAACLMICDAKLSFAPFCVRSDARHSLLRSGGCTNPPHHPPFDGFSLPMPRPTLRSPPCSTRSSLSGKPTYPFHFASALTSIG